jgi:hypothetical protein
MNIDLTEEVNALRKQAEDLFAEAKAHDESEWQSSLHVLFYTDKRRYSQHGFGMLLDRNPPWNGAVKDFFLITASYAERFKQKVNTMFEYGISPLQPYSASEIKEIIYKALQANKHEGIRLPQDLVSERDVFLEFWDKLPQTPSIEPFTREDFNALTKLRRSAESIMDFEQNVGREIIENGVKTIVPAHIANMFSGGAMPSSIPPYLLEEMMQNADMRAYMDRMIENDEALLKELRALPTDVIFAKFRDAGADMTQEEFIEQAKLYYSEARLAMDLGDKYVEDNPDDPEDIEDLSMVMCATEVLVERLLPEVPYSDITIENIEDRFTQAYDMFEDDGTTYKVLREWQWCWEEVKKFINDRNASVGKKILSLEELDTAFIHLASFDEWLSHDLLEMSMEIQNDHPPLLEDMREMIADVLTTLPETDAKTRFYMQREVGELYFTEGLVSEGEAAFVALAEEFPQKAELYEVWANQYSYPRHDAYPANAAKAEEIIKQGLARTDLDEPEYLQETWKMFQKDFPARFVA